MNDNFMLIDHIPVKINGEKNLLELIRKAGIELPTLCYYSELSVYGACRMCMVENKWGNMEAACSTPPKAGMEIYTNTPRLRKYRKMILELLLSNHCRDCTACEKNGNCKLQELAQRFGIRQVRFINRATCPELDTSSLSITRDKNKCILCGDCVRMCNEVQKVGAIDFAYRGSKMTVSTAFNAPIAASGCVGCGQCAAVCPTGAITVKNDCRKVWDLLSDQNTLVTAQIAPAVRVAMGAQLGYDNGIDTMGKIVAVLRRLGFDHIFDTSTGADLTVIEETGELVSRLEKGENLPLFTSCCPAWVKYAEQSHPDLLKNLSTCRSPMQMFASIIKKEYKKTGKKVAHVAIMPCTAKKMESAREEFKVDGMPNVDYVLTTQELIEMLKEAGLLFKKMEPEAVDMPFGAISGAGILFGVTGGVTEAVIRRLSDDKSIDSLRTLAFNGVRGMEGLKEATIPYGDRELKIAVVSGLGNAEALIQKMKHGEASYDFIEVMACPGGCIAGGGQPFTMSHGKQKRADGLYQSDRMCSVKRSEENPLMMSLYSGILKDSVHSLLHVDYTKSSKISK